VLLLALASRVCYIDLIESSGVCRIVHGCLNFNDIRGSVDHHDAHSTTVHAALFYYKFRPAKDISVSTQLGGHLANILGHLGRLLILEHVIVVWYVAMLQLV
jgi:hypothetical protein